MPVEEDEEPEPGAVPGHRGQVAPAPAAGTPVVRVSIGRIEVRGAAPEPGTEARPAPERQRPALSLDDYLARRSGERR